MYPIYLYITLQQLQDNFCYFLFDKTSWTLNIFRDAYTSENVAIDYCVFITITKPVGYFLITNFIVIWILEYFNVYYYPWNPELLKLHKLQIFDSLKLNYAKAYYNSDCIQMIRMVWYLNGECWKGDKASVKIYVCMYVL